LHIKTLALCVGLLLGTAVRADTDPAQGLLGHFGHGFTEPAGEVVWTVTAQADGYALLAHGDQSRSLLHRLTPAEVGAFWQKMLWPPATRAGVQCVGDDESVFCQVPPAQRQQIDWLAGQHSDYFFYSEMGGVMEIQRLGPP
jgi:hypothetical protein